MYLKSIQIQNFRNFSTLETSLSPGVNIFYGDNGSGKTNFLEAIFVLCLGRSHRGATEAVMIQKDYDLYRLEGEISLEEGDSILSVAYQKSARKKITLDKIRIKIAELYSHMCAVAAGPEDCEILLGSPATRRTFLDIYLSQFSPKYLNALISYQKVLAQKNASLKRKMDPSPFNELLVQYGGVVIKSRLEFLVSMNEQASKYYSNISGGEDFSAEYRPTVKLESGVWTEADINEAFRKSLEASAEKERVMEISLVGPHRDDVYFSIDSLPARTHGSQGELRTAAIALKLAVYHLLKEKRQTEPLLLLDEIFAELDHKRTEGLIGAFEDFSQLFLTTAMEPPEFLKNKSTSYRISEGQIVGIG